ncbi:tRNA pseudouridine(55) synthase TruB [Pseudolysinimonas yzui]|uniref:tRNA pseudouridine synthase B n=1 Tax=Pseudolysinimonas yzui TaxID=2708254 RepID=A0A8J3M031_9MICO|nr:tRNA pseudouridine(55) synthase TruB [Pseudolysinimonas yzui]GHF07741.1 tRNA pseudouridine synthase B [Pseudolysinimonas yzui]
MPPVHGGSGGILLLDKPQGPTSHDLVARTRRALGTRKVGHAGTLDPMATGLMILGVGSSTRLLTYLVGLDKEYTATIRLGQSTTTDDAEGEVVAETDASGVTPEAIAAEVTALTGEIAQVPSSFSAIKVDGRRSYDRARAGEEVDLPPRPVTVSEFAVLSRRAEGPLLDLDVRVAVSSGTYVRALARDLGRALGVGGHLTALRRTRIGPFDIATAVHPDDDLAAALLPPAEVAARLFPTVSMDADTTLALSQGKRVAVAVADAPVVAALAPGGRLAGLVSVRDGVCRVLVNFPTEEVLT